MNTLKIEIDRFFKWAQITPVERSILLRPIVFVALSYVNRKSKLQASPNKGVNYNLYLSSCVNHTARALTLAGVPAIGIHPFILHSQMVFRSLGITPMLYSHYFYQY
jgi:hypothetical protein